MEFVGQLINSTLLILFVVLTWVAPRRFGVLGITLAHCVVGVGVFVMGIVALVTGIWPDYDGASTILGILLQAFLLNCLLLPLAGFAAWRHSRAGYPTVAAESH